jgi:hypothetical protein
VASKEETPNIINQRIRTDLIEFKVFTTNRSKSLLQFTQVVEVVALLTAGIFEVMNASSLAAASRLKLSSALA